METKNKQTKEETEKQKRAIGYALSLVCIQEVGIGPDKNLGMVRQIISEIISLCEDETGIELEGYPTQFLKDNKELLMGEKIPYTLIRMVKEQEGRKD